MSNVKEFPGTSNFDPDNVLAEEERASSAFQRDTGSDESYSDTSGKPKAAFPLVKMLVIGAVLIVVGGTIFMTVKPLLATKPAATSIPVMPVAQSQAIREVAAQGPAPVRQELVAQPQAPMAAITSDTPAAQPYPQAGDVTAPAAGGMTSPSINGAVLPAAIGGSDKSQGSLPANAPAASAVSADVRLAAVELRAAHLEVQLAAMNEVLESIKSQQGKGEVAKEAARRAVAPRPRPVNAVTKPATGSTSVRHESRVASGSGPTLKAVLTDRAWFQTASGSTITVSTGDSVPGYGQVQSINADAGEVRFSNGTVVR